jgi:hypothetical protein
MIAPSFSKIAPAEAIDDTASCDARPSRRFRARRTPDGFWLVRKSGTAFLRTFSRNVAPVADTDPEIATAWFAAAWPELLFAKANRKSRQAGVRRTGGRK